MRFSGHLECAQNRLMSSFLSGRSHVDARNGLEMAARRNASRSWPRLSATRASASDICWTKWMSDIAVRRDCQVHDVRSASAVTSLEGCSSGRVSLDPKTWLLSKDKRVNGRECEQQPKTMEHVLTHTHTHTHRPIIPTCSKKNGIRLAHSRPCSPLSPLSACIWHHLSPDSDPQSVAACHHSSNRPKVATVSLSLRRYVPCLGCWFALPEPAAAWVDMVLAGVLRERRLE